MYNREILRQDIRFFTKFQKLLLPSLSLAGLASSAQPLIAELAAQHPALSTENCDH